MKVLVVCGSPHKNGTTNALAEAFISGIDLNKHQVEKIQLADKKIAPCKGCDYCKKHDGKCVSGDDMELLNPSILEADVLVFVSPLYYFGFTAQLKAFIDRFYAINAGLHAQTEKKAILLTAGADTDDSAMDGIVANYETMVRYLGWKNIGEICAYGCAVKENLVETSYLEEAKKLGESL